MIYLRCILGYLHRHIGRDKEINMQESNEVFGDFY